MQSWGEGMGHGHPKDPPWAPLPSHPFAQRSLCPVVWDKEGTPTWGPRGHPTLLRQCPPWHMVPPAVGANSCPPAPPAAAQPRCLDLEDNVLEIIALIKKG